MSDRGGDMDTLDTMYVGETITVGHPANNRIAVKVRMETTADGPLTGRWLYMDTEKPVDPEDFRAGWQRYEVSPAL